MTIAIFKVDATECDKRRLAYSSKYDRLAFTTQGASQQAGWVNPDGVFTAIDKATHPDFGSTSDVTAVGFDKHDNFYYTRNFGSTADFSDQTYSEYYRTPAGSTGPGQLLGRVTHIEADTFGWLPDGTLGFDAPVPMAKECPSESDSMYVPNMTVFYEIAAGRRQLFKTTKYCTDDGQPIMPPANFGFSYPVVSPDGSRVAFQADDSRIFMVDANGQGLPTPLPISGLPESSVAFRLVEWV